ncbi:MAG TPA: ABC transporter ATP-binding protein [Anaerolineales bacterium]|nr:ABC transporter ATP-binding protein [Anaerolineales bacterium]
MKASTGRNASLQPDGVIVQMTAVNKVYNGLGGQVTALTSIDLHVQKGEFVVLTGKSGSGKTTLVNCLTGLDRCTSGSILVNGSRVDRMSAEAASRWRRQNVGVVFQSFELLPTLTAAENVMLPMDFAGKLGQRDMARRAIALLESVGIAEHAPKVPSALSGGQQQRLAIARALANDPSILVADEPTGSLDSATADAVLAVFEDLVANGKTVVLVTHDKDVAAHGSRVLALSDGRILGSVEGAVRA